MEKVKIVVEHREDRDNPMTIHDDVLRVDWVNLDEGYSGDYDPDDPEDVNLLRFDVYERGDPKESWNPVDDGSYCTMMPANAPIPILEKALRRIFDAYREHIDHFPGESLNRIGEKMSHISDEDIDFQIPDSSQLRAGTRVYVSGDSADLGIEDYNVRVSTVGVLVTDAAPREKRVLVTLDEIDGDQNVTVLVNKRALRI